jgi:hypothetical protein
MFTAKTPEDYFKATTTFFEKFPKSADDVKSIFDKTQKVFETEYANSQEMVKLYQKAVTGSASINEIATANKKAIELAKFATFSGIACLPGGLIALPVIANKAKDMNIDIVPKSVIKHFDM